MKKSFRCTTCWASFELSQLRYIAEHPSLTSDPVAGKDTMLRFRASVFDNRGAAVDPAGASCTSIACPRCRCELPRRLLADPMLPISVVGSPASGKSCLLATGLRALRKCGPKLGFSLIDAAPSLNTHIHDLEEKLFPQEADESHVHIGKTDPSDLSTYEQIVTGIGETTVPRPIHLTWCDKENPSRTIVFQDTAGEAFVHKNKMSPAIEHLASASSIIFVLDPLQDPATRHALHVNDPQLDLFEKGGSSRQDLLILETADRIRRLKGLSNERQLDIPMIFVINKFDAWSSLLKDVDVPENPILQDNKGNSHLDDQLINDANRYTRNMLTEYVPDWIDSIDSISSNATIIPCAPLGISPTGNEFGALEINTARVSPIWAHIPFLLAIQKGFKFEQEQLDDSSMDQL